MPFQDLSIFRRSCILDCVHCRCSLPPPLGPPPGTPLGLSAGGANLAGAPPERNRGGQKVLAMGMSGGACGCPGVLGGGTTSHAVPYMNCWEGRFTMLDAVASSLWDKQGKCLGQAVPGAWRCPVLVRSPG